MNNDISLGIALLDTGTSFTIFDKSSENDLPYGTFALTLINTDYEKLNKSIANIIHLYFEESFNSHNTEQFITSLYNKIDYHISYASKGYLPTGQAHMVTNLLVREILNKIENKHFKITDMADCIPIIFTSFDIHNQIEAILQRHSTDLTTIIDATNTHEISSQLFNMETPVYFLNITSDYLLLDLKMYLERSNKTVNKCKRCKRLFLPTRKSDKYCRLPIRGNNKTCNVIMHISPDDEFSKRRNTARDKQHKRIRYYYNSRDNDTETILLKLYEKWSKKCAKKCVFFKSNEDIKGFEKWIDKTKFTTKKIDRILEICNKCIQK